MRKIYCDLQSGFICFLVFWVSPLAAQTGGYTGGGGSTSPTIAWNPAFAGTGSAGMVPTFSTGNITTAGWTTDPFIMCYNGKQIFLQVSLGRPPTCLTPTSLKTFDFLEFLSVK